MGIECDIDNLLSFDNPIILDAVRDETGSFRSTYDIIEELIKRLYKDEIVGSVSCTITENIHTAIESKYALMIDNVSTDETLDNFLSTFTVYKTSLEVN